MGLRYCSRASRRALSFSVALGVALSLALPALAQPAPATDAPEVSGTGATYAVKFVDDPLHALNDGSIIPRIRVRPVVGRVTLIRPRTQFVTEMLKSAEHF